MSHLETRILLIGFVPCAFTAEGCFRKTLGVIEAGMGAGTFYHRCILFCCLFLLLLLLLSLSNL